MSVNLPALWVAALVALRICACFNVNPVSLQDVFGHGEAAARRSQSCFPQREELAEHGLRRSRSQG